MRIAHTMLRVSNLTRSIKFYTEILNMDLLICKDFPNGKFTIAYVGYGGEFDGALIELTHNWEINEYELGNGFGHIAIYTEDVFAIWDKIILNGGNVKRMPGPKKYGETIIAFATDPDGYTIEFVEYKKLTPSID